MDDLATILEQARRLRTAEERRQFLESACRGDADMRRRLERMLEDATEAEAFFGETETNGSGEIPNALVEAIEAPGATIGRYKLLQKLGEGGFGIVYMAEQREPVKRRVALKIIKLGMDTGQVVARFEAERQALAMMDHPNIAKVLDAGATERGRPFFVMELIKGVPITRYCDDNRLTTRERLELFIPVCQAVQHAHQKGVIHRDLKPSNIMVTLHDGVPVPKVIDFGIAKATQQELTGKTLFTQYGQFIGTPVYMSPEQAEMSGLDIDTRSDIYSLGVVLYELLVGRTPLDARKLLAGGFDEIRRQIREEEVPKPSTRVSTLDGAELTTIAGHRKINPAQLRGELSGDLDWVVLKALEKDRTRRYETPSAFALDIKHYLENEPVSAVAPNAAYLLRKYARRHRAALIVVAAMAGILVAGTAVSTWQAFRATRAQKTAETAREAEKQARQREEDEKTNAQRQLYVARVNLMQAAWEQNNVGRVKDLLALTADSPNHGFEWYYWQRQIHADRRTLWGHFGWINQLAFSPDGTRIVTVSSDKTARIWDVASGKELRILKGHQDWVTCVAVSPDGRRIATGSANDHRAGDYSVRVWDSATGSELLRHRAHTNGVNCVAFSPDGERIASGGGGQSHDTGDRTVRVWEAATGKELLKFTGHTDRVTQVRFSPDGRQIVSCSNPGGDEAPPRILKVWDAATMREVLTFNSGDDSIAGFAFVPEGLRVVTGNTSGLAKVWDPAGPRELLTLHGHKVLVTCVAYSRDGRWIATGSEDQTARLWDAANGKELQVLRGHSTGINSITFSPDDRQVATAGGDWTTAENRTARIWDVAGVANPLTISQLTTGLSAVAFSPDGRRIVTTGDNDRIGGTVAVWDTSDGRKLLDLKGHTNWAGGVAFSPDGQRIVTGSADSTAKVWDSNTGRELLTLAGHRGVVWGALFTPDGKQVITSGSDSLIKEWDAVSGRPLLSIRGNLGRFWAVALSPDGRRIAAGGDLGAGIWDATTGKALFRLKGLNQGSVSVAFSPDGRRLFTALANGAKVWDATTGDELLSFKGHGSQVWSADYSPDGRRIVTGGFDTTAKVWDAMTGEEVLTLVGHDAQIRGVAFSPDGQSIATVSWDKTVKIWRSATAEQVDTWTREERDADEYVSRQSREEAAELDRARAGRAQDAGAIKQWLVLAPVPYEGRDGLAALNRELIPSEANLRPHAGDHVKVGEGELVWKAVTGDTDLIDFHNAAGIDVVDLRGAPKGSAYDYAYAVAYAVTFVESDGRQTNLVLEATSGHQSKVYLNGEEIYARRSDPGSQLNAETVHGVTLQAGLNVIVFKVVNVYGGWAGSVHFTDAAGQPLKGIRVTLEPKASLRPK